METKFNMIRVERAFEVAMARVNHHVEMYANSLQSAYASKAHARLVNDDLFGGPLGLNRSRAAKLADRAILGWL